MSTPTAEPTLEPTATTESSVLVLSSEVFGLLIVLLIAILCAVACCCRKNEAKRKILDLLAEAQLDVDAEDLVDDHSDGYKSSDGEDDLTAQVTTSSYA
jgi:hypothetical protein